MMHSGVSNMRQQMMAFRSRGMRNEDKDAFQIGWTEYFLLGTVELEPARTAHLSSDAFWANNIVPGSNLRKMFSNLCRMHCGLLHKNAERIYAECIGLPAASHERRANHFSALDSLSESRSPPLALPGSSVTGCATGRRCPTPRTLAALRPH